MYFHLFTTGIQPYGNELQPFTKTLDLKSAYASLDDETMLMKTIYTTVRCHSKAGLYVSAASDGVTISDNPPSADYAELTLLPTSKTEYSTGEYHQRDPTTIRMKWSGFTDQFDIMSFVVSTGIEVSTKLTFSEFFNPCFFFNITYDCFLRICRNILVVQRLSYSDH
jgi:hypothetical protein